MDLNLSVEHVRMLVQCGLTYQEMADVTGEAPGSFKRVVEAEGMWSPSETASERRNAARLLKRLGDSAEGRWLNDVLDATNRLPTAEEMREEAA
jgi:hypothetical protein